MHFPWEKISRNTFTEIILRSMPHIREVQEHQGSSESDRHPACSFSAGKLLLHIVKDIKAGTTAHRQKVDDIPQLELLNYQS